MPALISAKGLRKEFTVHKKEPGFLGSLKSLFSRETIVKQAVKDVSFDVAEGEILGLIGANGAGKTTIVKMLAGIIHPSAGEARVLGHDPWKRENAFRRQIALIMGQKAQLWWDLPAADCFLLLREIYQIPKDEHERRMKELADVLAVHDQLHIQIRRLSLGERMKMELMAALLHAPRVVYLDEPTIGLDVGAQRAIREFLLRYQAQHGPAMILTSHYMEDIERLCRRIIIVREGELVYDGSLDEVVRRYAKYKILTVRLAEDAKAEGTREELEKIGEVLACTPTELKVHVPRGSVAQSAAAIVQRWPVADLTIEEEDIGSIIEQIIHAKTA